MRLLDIYNANQVLNTIAKDKSMCVHLAYWTAKFLMKTQSDCEFMINRIKEIVEMNGGSFDEDGKAKIPDDKVTLITEEMKKLEDTEVEDPGIRFSLSELSEEIKISMSDLVRLMPFIDEEK